MALPDFSVFTGVGGDYEQDTYDSATGKYYTNWAAGLAAFAGGQFAPTSISGVTAAGVFVSFFNKLVTVAGFYNFQTQKIQAGIGIGVSLNN
jgi:hypothetical protein